MEVSGQLHASGNFILGGVRPRDWRDRARLDALEKNKKNISPKPGFESRGFRRPARSLVITENFISSQCVQGQPQLPVFALTNYETLPSRL